MINQRVNFGLPLVRVPTYPADKYAIYLNYGFGVSFEADLGNGRSTKRQAIKTRLIVLIFYCFCLFYFFRLSSIFKNIEDAFHISAMGVKIRLP
jgi:hypothetical protein